MAPSASFPAPQSFVPPSFLNITAIAAENSVSVFQCWQILPGFSTSSQTGTAGASILQLGTVANMSYSVLPPGFDAGQHNAPAIQWVSFLSGKAVVTLADGVTQATIQGGKDGFIFVTDTAERSAKGHSTKYPSDVATIALQIPTGGIIPQHNVLHSGPCKPENQKRNVGTLDALD